jgi:hypothetical protein
MRLMSSLSVSALLAMSVVGGGGCAGAALSGRPVNEQNRLGSKSEEGCTASVLGLVTTGDATAANTARKAHISRITHVDHKFENLFGVYAKYCVTVFGD